MAVYRRASDVHVHSLAPLKVRISGQLQELESEPLDPRTAGEIIREILTPEQRTALDERGQIDFSYTLPGVGRFRGNAYRQQRGVDAVFRAIPPEPPSLTDLGLPTTLARFCNYHQGMVLLTGPAGCGKSSTLAALLRIINEERRDHIITVEDPIEYIHHSKQCVVNQRQVGRHTGTFARALRAALREDPDVIALGELRDLETISLALTAAETGHLVIATLHTSNAIRTINRVLGVFPPEQQDQIRTMVSESLRAVVSQRLVNRADGQGRVVALEVLVCNKAVGNLIRENKTFQIRSVLQTGGAQGMCLLDASLGDLVKKGIITNEEAARHADEPAKFLSPKPAAAPGVPHAPVA
ncbi:MAG TPA: type IV pilus twitching motility protein PilT [Thermoanaerobaculia bacterium]|nr:type IV pilus twitching motility protein PilT [Thermoanaerobaculia bacterium]